VAVTTIAFGSGRPNNISVGALAVRLANPEAAEKMSELAHDEPVDQFDAEGFDRLVSFTRKGTNVQVWEPAVKRLVGRYRVRNQAYRAALAEDGRFLIVAHRDSKDLYSGGQVSLVTSDGEVLFSTTAKDLVHDLACDAAGRISVRTDGNVTLWESDTASTVRQLRPKQFTRIVFSRDSTHLLVEAGKNGSLVAPVDRAKPATHLPHSGSIWTQEFVGDGAEQVVTVGNTSYGTNPTGDPQVRLWDVARAKPLALRRRIELAPIAITRDGRRMATTASDGSVQVRRIADGRLQRRITTEAKVTQLLFDADGANLAMVTKTSLEIWRVADGARAAKLAIEESRTLDAFDVAQGLALLLDSYASSGSVVRLADGRTIVDHVSRPHVDFTRGLVACIREEKKIEVGRLNTKERPLMNAFHEGAIGVELAPDGAHLVSAGTDGSARIWQLADGAEIARLEHPDRVLRGSFSPDSRLIATVCSDNIVRLWTWRAEDLIAEGQSRIARRLTSAELDSFLPDPETRRI
jgi:WD40 repeat protein